MDEYIQYLSFLTKKYSWFWLLSLMSYRDYREVGSEWGRGAFTYLAFIISLLLYIFKTMLICAISIRNLGNRHFCSCLVDAETWGANEQLVTWVPQSEISTPIEHPEPSVSQRHTKMERREMTSSVAGFHMSRRPRTATKQTVWKATCICRNDSFEEREQKASAGPCHADMFLLPLSFLLSSKQRVAMTEFSNPVITKADGQSVQQLYLQWKSTQASPHHFKP